MVEPDLWDDSVRRRPFRLGVDAGLATLFTAVALVPAIGQHDGRVVVVTVLMGAAVMVRRVAWPVVVVLAGVAGLVQFASGQVALVADAGFALVFFVLGSDPSRAVRRFGLAGALMSSVVIALGVALGYLGAAGTGGANAYSVISSAALALLVSGGGWVAGFVRWQRRSRITAQVQAGLAAERARLAADMHDLVAHTWAVVAVQADGARYALAGPDGADRAEEALEVIADTARGSISDLRDLLAELRDERPHVPSGGATRHALVARARASGMDLRLVEHGAPPTTEALAASAHRLLTESLTNALKHGDLAHPVVVEEDWSAGYRLVVRNRIRRPSTPGAGHGIAGMRERVLLLGGILRAGAEGDMWTLLAVLPEPPP
ncbi:hypothetical protein KMZ30_06845 [Phycicoccus sp. KQZ13P-1]|uniref:sensor histidine kinase n=1 Tax=Phycicoccus mangrovi TaxID=2840470 RepID=UPI001C007EE8|nr:histidine kinase [Phycicoccus mangrovi]MBT9255292.1 hypothetical protein [Phycicoccus mangrovi]